MSFAHKGRQFSFVVGSDVDRDGMYLEVSDATDRSPVLEIFYSDRTNDITLSAFRPEVPLEVIEWALDVARQRLVPK